MSPRKVDRAEKRRNIAISCSDLIHDVGLKNLTVAQVAKTAGIGKGTVYEYFENKEDIIFEIININIEKYNEEFIEGIKKLDSLKEKLKLFFKFVLDNSEDNLKHLNGYKEFLSIVLSEDNLKMKAFNCDTNEFFRGELQKVFTEEISKGKLKEEALNLVDGIMTYQKGLALKKMTQLDFDENENFDIFIDTILKLLQIKGK